MDINEKNTKKLQRMLQAMDEDSLTREEFKAAFNEVMKIVLSIKDSMVKAVEDLEKRYADTPEQIVADNFKIVKNIERHISQIIKGKDGYSPVKGKDYFDGANGKAGLPGRNGKDGRDGRPGSPDTPEMILKKLRQLPAEKGLRIDDIYDLRRLLGEIKGVAQRVIPMGGSAGGGGRIVKSYDLSSSLNGVLKTFSLPAFWRIISVHSTAFPNAFRETTDYTYDASAMTITFTSQINADTTLAAGQTIIVVYSE